MPCGGMLEDALEGEMLMSRAGSDHPPPRLRPTADLQLPPGLYFVTQLYLGDLVSCILHLATLHLGCPWRPVDCCVTSLPFTISWSLLSPPVPNGGGSVPTPIIQ